MPPVSFCRLAGTRVGIAAASNKQYGRDIMAIDMGGFSLWQGEACLLVQEFTHRHFITAMEKAIPMQPLPTKVHAAL